MNLKEKFGQATLAQISSIQSRYSVMLPTDYKQFLITSNGGICDYEYSFFLEEDKAHTEITMDLFYGISVGEGASIETYMDMFDGELFPNALIIGDDLMGGMIVLVAEGDDRGVYYWDHAYKLDGSDDDTNTYYICDTFTDFVKILTTGIAGE